MKPSQTKRLERAIKEERDKLKAIFEGIGDGISVITRDRKVSYTNSIMRKLFGSGIIGQICHWVYYGTKETCTWCPAAKTFEDGKIHTAEMSNPDGITWEITSSPMFDEDGSVYSVVEITRDMSSRKKTEKALSQSEQHLQAILQAMQDLIFVVDRQGKCISFFWGKEKYDTNPPELIGKGIDKLLPKNVADLFREKSDWVFQNGQAIDYENSLTWGGKPLWFSMTLSPIFGRDGAVSAVLTTGRDITYRKRIEDALDAERRQFLSIFDSIDEIIYVSDPHSYELLFANKAARKTYGADIRGKKCYRTLHGVKRPCEFCTNSRIFGENLGKSYIWVFRNEKNNGYYRCIDRAIRWPDGRLVRYEMAIDITERVEAERALIESEQKYRELVEHANSIIIKMDLKGNIIFFNEYAQKFFGFKASEIMGKNVVGTIVPSELKDMILDIPKYPTKYQVNENVNITKDGRRVWVSWANKPIFNAKGESIGTIAIGHDITDRKQMEERFLQTEKLKALGEMAGGVAHDFNNFLAAILGRAQLMKLALTTHGEKDRRLSTKNLLQGLDVIERASSDAAETVRRIQEFTRTKAEKKFVQIDLNQMVKEVLELTRPRWKDESESRGIRFRIKEELKANRPVEGIPSELREVLINLVINALDAMPSGGELTIRTETHGPFSCVSVADTGIGIPRELQRQIFDPFLTTKGPKSSGLGLSVSYGIIERHGGEISLLSGEGRGTTFHIKLPTAGEFRVDIPQEKVPKETEKANILVIDDEPEIRNSLCEILSLEGHRVMVAKNGKEGLSAFRANEFDMVLTDLGMPGMSGWQLAKKIKSLNPRTPVAIITGWGLEPDPQQMKETGVDLFIAKPFRIGEIRKLVTDVMQLGSRARA
ncbi:MAG: PAS domain S-box protein [Proteobacteria bacterium]|nr:PAS domain S-box protein [Pseudomonadota bacterium]NIS70852.1 PAS domain S-box protein [Pseudomonadota bacterium]